MVKLINGVAAAIIIGLALPACAGETGGEETPQLITAGDGAPEAERIAPGVSHYLRYRQAGESVTPIDLITQKVSVTTGNGDSMLLIEQTWSPPGENAQPKTIESWLDPATLAPSAHIRKSWRDGALLIEGFRFEPGQITGLEDLENNARADYLVEASYPSFNFETDLLVLQAIEWSEDHSVEIVFHHPGGPPPAPYLFEVIGSEELSVAGESTLPCWIVRTDYNRPDFPATRFWIAKSTGKVIKVVSPIGDDVQIVKTLIW